MSQQAAGATPPSEATAPAATTTTTAPPTTTAPTTTTAPRPTTRPTTRSDYPHFLALPTRWMDNDVYGHINNVVYYSFFDTAINRYLIDAGLDIAAGPVIGLAVETGCRFLRPLAFPDLVEAGLRVGHLGTSSVRYEISLFAAGVDEPAASGHFVHVFVDRTTRRPTPIPQDLRAALQRIAAAPAATR